MKKSPLIVACGLAAGLPPFGLDVGAYGALLWLLVHDEARGLGATLSTDDALTILRAAAPELTWALVAAPGLKWLQPLLGMGLGGYFNVKAARNVTMATRLYLASGRRLRGHALRQELEEQTAAERKRQKLEKLERRLAQAGTTPARVPTG